MRVTLFLEATFASLVTKCSSTETNAVNGNVTTSRKGSKTVSG
jgi:hypothetical protein